MVSPFRSSILSLLVCGGGAVAMCRAASVACGAGVSDSEIEASELRATWETLARENVKLREKAKQAEEGLNKLQRNLVLANTETEVFKRQAQEFKQRIEAMGLDGVGGNVGRLEQRLLKAVNDLKLVEGERNSLQSALIRLSEAVIHFQKTAGTTDPEARGGLEAEMRHAARALGVVPPEVKEAAAMPATLQDGMIISIEDGLALVVANVGSRHGVKIGMPFQVVRADAPVGTVRVVDVRERIAGAVIEESRPGMGKINVGDRIKVVAQQ